MSMMSRSDRLLVCLFFILAAFASFAAGNVSSSVLPNGLKVIIKEVHAAPVVVVDTWYRVGSRNERPGLTGASHLLEHMTYKGTKEFGKDAMRNLTKRNGAVDNGATFYDYTHYYTTIASDRLELVLRMEASRMSSALIQQTDLDAERTVVRSELEGRENNPGSLLFQETMAAMFRAHPYHWPVIGWRSDVEHINAAQLRYYYHAYYMPNNATLVIAGDIEPVHVLAQVKMIFGRLKRGTPPSQWTTPEPPQYGERRVLVRRQGKVPMEMMAWHVPGLVDEDTPALSMLEQILGGGRLSRLYRQVVEKQIGVSSWASLMSLRDTGIFMIGGVASPGQPMQPIERTMLDEIGRIKSEPPSTEEMARALRQYEAAVIYNRDSITEDAGMLGEYETMAGDWRFPDQQLIRMRAVTPADVSRVARKYLTDDNRTVGIFQPVEKGIAVPGQPLITPEALFERKASFSSAPGAVPSVQTAGKARGNPVLRKRFVLSNGLVLIVQENHANPTIAVSASLKAGKAYDPKEKTGIADMVANLLDRGTTTRTSQQIAAEMEGAAASLEAGTGWETVGVHGKALRGDSDLLLRNLADVLQHATFLPEEISKMRAQMLSGLAMERDEPEAAARRAFYRALYPEGHPYRLPSFDEEEAGVKAISRDDLLAFYRARYSPRTMVVAVVGDIAIPEVQRMVSRYFGAWKGVTPPLLTFPKPRETPTKVITTIPDKSEAAIYIGHSGDLARTSPEYYAAEVMNMILGGGGALNSRFGDVIRDQHGLAYSVYSDFHASTGAGPWYAALGVNPTNVNKAVSLLRSEISRVKEKGVTEQERHDAITYLTGSYAIALVTNSALANVLMDAEYFHLGLDYPERMSKLYRAVTLSQVNAAAKRYLHPERLSVSIAGSYDGH